MELFKQNNQSYIENFSSQISHFTFVNKDIVREQNRSRRKVEQNKNRTGTELDRN